MLRSEFDERLKNLGLTRKDFCDLTGFAYSSVSNWNDDIRPVPFWVENFLEYYDKSVKYDNIKKSLSDI